MAAYFQFTSPGFPFKVSARWIQDFKKEHYTRQRDVMKYISHRENATREERVNAAELFQKQRSIMIPDYNLDYVININQTGCEYHQKQSSRMIPD
jgi:hypothetical protein